MRNPIGSRETTSRGYRHGVHERCREVLGGENLRACSDGPVDDGANAAAQHSRQITCAIDLFIEDGAYTTVAAAVAILVVLALLFSSVGAIWSLSRAEDVQVVADNTALAGSNVVASYHTAATVVDASIASLGFSGLAVTGVGLVGLLVPGARSAATKAVDAGIRLLDARNSFAKSASKGLKTLETSLPYLVAANGAKICVASGTDRMRYSGTALAVPVASASEFPALESDGIDTQALKDVSDGLDEVAAELEQASEETARAKERAWLADCGRDGYNMQERAAKLTGLSGVENPDYESSITWEPSVGVERTRAYYRWRLTNEKPEGKSVEARADSAARKEFYRFAVDQFKDAEVSEYGGTVVSTVPLLPKNTSEIRQTTLYTDALWPTTMEPGGLTIHYGAGCPGATGAAGARVSFAQAEGGSVRECETCRFGVGDMGKTPAASTSIQNGYEYHLREFTLALDDYVAARNREFELERQAQEQAESAGDAFEEALAAISGKRPRIAPPGRYGCVAAVVTGEVSAPESLDSSFSSPVDLGPRGAISASALAVDPATKENNVLSQFFSSIEQRTSDFGVTGLVGSVMDLWGSLLVSYSDLGEGLSSKFDELTSSLGATGPVGTWLKEKLSGVVGALGLEPVDLSLRKPVLVDSSKVIAHADVSAISGLQDRLRSLAVGSIDPAVLAQALGYQLGEYIAEKEFTIAEIPLPGGGTIPLTIRLRDIASAMGGDG